jgi:hypothetical protein
MIKYWVGRAEYAAAWKDVVYYDSEKLGLTGTKPIINGVVIDIASLGFTTEEHDVTTVELMTAMANSEALTEADVEVLTRLQYNGGLSPSLLTALVDYKRAAEPTEDAVGVSSNQGKWLSQNHESFIKEATEEI